MAVAAAMSFKLIISLIFLGSAALAKDFRCSYLNVKVQSINETFLTCEFKNIVFRSENETFNTVLPTGLPTHLASDHIYDDAEEYVERINFKSSRIYAVPNSIFTLFKNLRVFDASHTRLHEINSLSFNKAEFLAYIFLQSNKLGPVLRDNVFVHCRNLRVLDVSANRISEIQKLAFNALSHLEQLNLAQNHIKSLEEGSFQSLIALKWIWLNDNKIEHLSAGTFGRENVALSGINLNANSALTAISAHTFESLKQLRFLFLAGCGCINENFLNFHVQDNVGIKFELKACSVKYREIFPDADKKFELAHQEDLLSEDCRLFMAARSEELRVLDEFIKKITLAMEQQ